MNDFYQTYKPPSFANIYMKKYTLSVSVLEKTKHEIHIDYSSGYMTCVCLIRQQTKKVLGHFTFLLCNHSDPVWFI